jgi:hypothetical protein
MHAEMLEQKSRPATSVAAKTSGVPVEIVVVATTGELTDACKSTSGSCRRTMSAERASILAHPVL